jgi:hypothetical protein
VCFVPQIDVVECVIIQCCHRGRTRWQHRRPMWCLKLFSMHVAERPVQPASVDEMTTLAQDLREERVPQVRVAYPVHPAARTDLRGLLEDVGRDRGIESVDDAPRCEGLLRKLASRGHDRRLNEVPTTSHLITQVTSPI